MFFPFPLHFKFGERTARILRLALLTAYTTALPVCQPACADEIIDGGATETVPGSQSSPWAVTGDLYVGDTSTGTLEIGTGGVVTNVNGVVGNAAGSIGSVTLAGPAAIWTNSAELKVGVSGTGTLNSTNGTISSVAGYLGGDAGSSGSVSLTNSTWTMGNLFIGVSGNGDLQVLSGSTLATNEGVIGANAGSAGTVTLDGTGSAWNANNISVGAAGQGSLTISGGANVDNQYTAIGDAPGAVGEVTVTGAGSSWTHVALPGGVTYLGKSGSGTLTVSDGGHYDPGIGLSLGYFAGSDATITVTGANSLVSSTGDISTVSGDSAHVTVSDGGTISANFMGLASALNSLTVETGGQLQLGSLNISGQSSTVIFQSGAVASTGSFSMNANVLNDLTVQGGSTITSDYFGFGDYGGAAPSTAIIAGAGTTWLNIGLNFESGDMTITDGATMTSNGYSYVGDSGPVGTAHLIVTGSGSSLSVNDELDVGYYGAGVVDVLSGASLSTNLAIVGAYAGGPTSGEVTVDGAGSTWTNSGDLTIGLGDVTGSDPVPGTVNITNGGVVSTNNATLGLQATGIGTATVTGAGSQFNTTTSLVVGDGGQGTLNIAHGGNVTVPTLTIANQVDSIGTVNVGADAGQSAVLRGTLDAASIVFGAGDGTLVFNHTDTVGYTFASDMSGTGAIDIEAGKTIFTGDSTAFTGTTMIGNAQLAVNGTLGGQVDVGNGGTLSGIGTVGGFTALGGGHVAPGNSIGTLSVSGDVAFNPGSIYQVEIDSAGQSDLIDATGTATISGGTVQATSAPGAYVPMTYTILTAAAGVTGAYDSVTEDLALLQSRLVYDSTNVYLELYVIEDFCAATRTANECSVANALGQFPADNPVYEAVIGLDGDGARQAFNALSGELHATVSGTLANDSRYVREAIGGRLIQAFYSDSADQSIALTSASAPTNVASINSNRMSLGALRGAFTDDDGGTRHDPGRITYWSRAFGAWGQFEGDGNAATADRSIGGFLTGADVGMGDGWRAGLATGYMQSSIGVGARSSSADVNSYVLAGYAGGSYGDVSVRTGAAWTWNGVDTTRNVIFPGFYELEKASYNAGTGQVFGELAVPMQANSVAWEPYLGLAYVQVNTGSFAESGATAALTASDKYQGIGLSTVGGRVATRVPVAGIMTTPHASLAWQYAFGSTTPEQGYVFASTGIGFGIAGVPLARSSALVEVGLDVAVAPNATLGLSYAGQLANTSQDDGVRGRLNWAY